MGNIATWLKEAEQEMDEEIKGIVVGKHWNRRNLKILSNENVILSREDGLRKLDKDYDSGYGGAHCFPMYAWTRSFVLFIHEYDGATWLNCVPRNPIACEPQFGGSQEYPRNKERNKERKK